MASDQSQQYTGDYRTTQPGKRPGECIARSEAGEADHADPIYTRPLRPCCPVAVLPECLASQTVGHFAGMAVWMVLLHGRAIQPWDGQDA